MVRRWGRIAGLVLIIAVAFPMLAQEKDNKEAAKAAADKTAAFYKLDLSVREMDGSKVVNTRTYTLNAVGNEWGRLRVGSKIPVSTGTYSPTTDSKPITQWQYIDVGLNADCHLVDSTPGPTLVWTVELSSVAPERGDGQQPIIRNVRSQGATLLLLNKPTLLSTADDLSSTHKFVFEITATQVK
ncbi:MAG TPA: hypothetical protein VFU86_21645 [Terriglobales bacterium]|nr:hypothetical protein [Terriglobales bacterium]